MFQCLVFFIKASLLGNIFYMH